MAAAGLAVGAGGPHIGPVPNRWRTFSLNWLGEVAAPLELQPAHCSPQLGSARPESGREPSEALAAVSVHWPDLQPDHGRTQWWLKLQSIAFHQSDSGHSTAAGRPPPGRIAALALAADRPTGRARPLAIFLGAKLR